jgi:uncharacterized protein DUF6221
MTDDLIAFVRARLDDTEALARAAGAGQPWRAITDGDDAPAVRVGTDDDSEWFREVNYAVWRCEDEQDGCPDEARGWIAEAQHIAHNDPARVLRQVQAHRAILEAYEIARSIELSRVSYNRAQDDGYRQAYAGVLRQIATIYSDHESFREEWRA